jgi:hypothetical protein
MSFTGAKYKPPGVLVEADTPGYNEHGYPLHACNGYIQDAHYWERVRILIKQGLVPQIVAREN